LFQRLYKYIFWTGYLAVLVATFLPIAGNIDKIRLGRGVFKIRLDYFLHFFVYFLICAYYLAGQLKGLKLFNSKSLIKFILVILLLASVTEVVQLWVPERTFNMFDLLSNMVGVGIGMGVVRMAQRRKDLTT
jgi:VanZ family protein